jgi:hypothetical protein
MAAEQKDGNGFGRDRPPVFGSWRRLHAAVLAILGVLILVFYLITRLFE